MAIKPQNS